MSYVTPKTSWSADQAPLSSDYNRVEGNTLANHDAILAEASARIAAVSAEEAARIAADALEVTNRNAAIAANIAAVQAGAFNLEVRASDPGGAAIGHMWLRSDL